MSQYAVVIAPLSEKDGGGFIGMVPDLVGCMSDGETHAEALDNTLRAIDEWIDEANRRGVEVPPPGAAARRFKAKQKAMEAAVTKIADVETRLHNLEVSISELSEQAENFDAWARFTSITGMEILSDDREKAALAC